MITWLAIACVVVATAATVIALRELGRQLSGNPPGGVDSDAMPTPYLECPSCGATIRARSQG